MKTVLVDPKLCEVSKNNLRALGYEVKEIPPFKRLPDQICGHPDILLFKMSDGKLLMGEEYYRENSEFYDSLGIDIITDPISPCGEYPSDVRFDALSVNNTLYGKAGAVSEILIRRYSRFVHVSQGYTRCSVALISDSGAITADTGISRALKKDGVDVLDISAGHICLNGYDYGFIGGAGGRLDAETYCFFGDLDTHPDGKRIKSFLRQKKINAVSLSGGPLCDHGSFLVIGL
jgi:hypothetical protein